MNAKLKNELLYLWLNLTYGTQLAFFRKDAFSKFIVKPDQAILLVAFNILLFFCGDYLKYLPNPTLNVYALAGFSQQLLGLLFTAFILAKLSGNNNFMLTFVIQVLSLTPFCYVVWPVVSQLVISPYNYYGYMLWVLAVIGFILFHHVGKNIKKTLTVAGAYSLLVISPAYFLPFGDFWYQPYQQASHKHAYNSINQENVFYAQHTHINIIESKLLPDRPGISDLYFLGFAGYASEDVFMKEIHYIQTLMDEKFDTKGRSVALINNLKTVNTTPLATKSNLALVLNDIGHKMNPDEDILFLYLTSHGSRSHELSVSFWPLVLNQIKPDDLKIALDRAGIKWRVLLVSSCYSGGFIEPLKNDYTLVMTASAPDRTSFGCGSQSNFTYFGSEVFTKQLANSYSFIPAFEKAITAITRREKSQGLKPSKPQLYVGNEISAKLELLEQELRQFYAHGSDG